VQPRPTAPGLKAGVSESMIAELVHAFYAKVRSDSELGPIFNAEIRDWEDHLTKLCAFWSSVTLLTGRYRGKPMPAHVKLAGIGDEHFKRWLQLFGDTAREICPPAAATLFVERAQHIAKSLQFGIAFHRGELPREIRHGAG
jgi:hemoglobin